ncbi:cytochrome c oxidase subunit 2 [Peribacillus deserti]|uniref:Cytochrome c oxidase subunit 2 n=1 Tax=Peribacillus deserti TaxID=673318 RepID=A0ABS2QGU9_9BACI|nr:cytochrome c oxidase subunit II [Peribacillus deserti]MBM7692405.1 cytochrome c oxidase subunit 2 [Peribacillus deserti]
MRKRLHKWRLISIFAILALALSGCGEPFLSTLTPAGEVAKKQYDLMILSTVIMVLVIIVVTVIFIYVIARFRRTKKNENSIPKQVEGNHKLEIIWTVIPILLLLVLAVPTVSYTFQLADVSPMKQKDKDGKTKDALVVNVRANLYWWEFEYPDLGIVTSQDLFVPTDKKVYFNVKSSDVKHSFWIPAVGGKTDTNPEGVNQFWLEFDGKGSEKVKNQFYGKCAELCGPSHAYMDFKVQTLSQDDFKQWTQDMKNLKKPAAEGNLAKEGEEIYNKSCIGCHANTANDSRPEQARTAPNLANFGDRTRIAGILEHNEENLKKWMQDPEQVKPGNLMTGKYQKLDEHELDALTAYLMGLKLEQ